MVANVRSEPLGKYQGYRRDRGDRRRGQQPLFSVSGGSTRGPMAAVAYAACHLISPVPLVPRDNTIRSGSASITSNTFLPNALTIFLA
jgi:hypothetical protein